METPLSAQNLEETMQYRAHAGSGMYGRESLPLMAGAWDDNGTLKALAIVAAGTVGFAFHAAALLGLTFGATADSTDRWVYPWMVPNDYRRDTGAGTARSTIVVRVKARKRALTSSVTDNADLALTLTTNWHSSNFNASTGVEAAGDAAKDTLAALSNTLNTLAAVDDDLVTDNFRWYEFDVGAGMTDAQISAVQAGATMSFALSVNEACGTNINVQVQTVEVVYTRHFVPEDQFRRDTAIGS